MSDHLTKNILATVCYFDILDYPLTSFELWKHMLRSDYYNEENRYKYSLGDVISGLKNESLRRFIRKDKGYYFLKDRKDLVFQRIRRNKISISKIRRLRNIIRILRFIPFVRSIVVTGRLAMKNAEPKSDWDVLVILKLGRIWIGRTAITVLSHLIGKRRHGNKVKDRVCLNYFLTEDSLEILTKDLFSSNEYFFCFPVFDIGAFKKFQLENIWISTYKPNYYIEENKNLKSVQDSYASRLVRTFLEKLLGWDFLEAWLEKIEKKKIMKNPKTAKKGSMVEASNYSLVFLPEPQGPRIFEKFKNRIIEIEKW